MTGVVCNICNIQFAELDIPIKCDSCTLSAHSKCTGLSATEVKCLSLKNRSLKYFCDSCDQGLKELPELKLLIKKLLVEVENLKNMNFNSDSGYTSSVHFSNEFIFNEINERNRCANNLLFYNIEECDSNRLDDRISFDLVQINNVIKTILVETSIIPKKVIRIGRSQAGKSRPIKVIFDSKSDVFDIIKNKRKLSQCNSSLSSINISTDRTLYQRETMKKLREELNQRTSKGEMDLTIKFVNGVPNIVKKSEVISTHSQPQQSQNFLK
ncbi:unnamed protein product [Macrosiphum euphorbiae]|uniref:Zinc finger PHD-type domain-containing protein n=1 Tax=Macrosiphum euphorbiae TaxID=13131 RepID=A0AAV0WWA7_9HEMI|nr:unnamed protein product [Macrosiphum euphorbiae]